MSESALERQTRRLKECEGYVVMSATRYSDYCDVEDLIAEGYLGVLHADRKFEDVGMNFLTYAAWWIRAYQRAFALDNRSDVRVPRNRVTWEGYQVSTAHLDQLVRDPHNKLGDYWVSLGETLAEEETIRERADFNLKLEAVNGALAKLDAREQQVVRSHIIDEEPFYIIGPRLGISHETARMICHRALRKIRRQLKPLLQEAA